MNWTGQILDRHRKGLATKTEIVGMVAEIERLRAEHDRNVCVRCGGHLEDPGEPMPDRSGMPPICSCCHEDVFS